MLNQFIDQITAQFQPAAQQVVSATQIYAERVIERLDAIRDAVQDDEFSRVRFRQEFPLPATGVADLGTVPVGSEWEINAVMVLAPDTAAEVFALVALYDSERQRNVWIAQADQVVSTGPAFGPAFIASGPGLSLFVPGGSTLELRVLFAGFPAGTRVTLDYEQKTRIQGRRKLALGVPPQLPTDDEPVPEVYRHTTPTVFVNGDGPQR